jgi:hypothetical protein
MLNRNFHLYLFISFVLIWQSCSHRSPTESKNKTPVDLQIIVDQTNSDSLQKFVKQLSGDLPVYLGNQPDTIKSRHKDFPGNDKAADFIQQKLEAFGIEAYTEQFTPSGRNVYGLQQGLEFSDQYYIICAHYDSMPDSSLSPGADDNASGTATVLEAARILSEYAPNYSIVYALWDEEEQGLLGSSYYAWNADQNDQNIQGVINIDMIGWDSNNDGEFRINVRDTANSVMLSDRMVSLHAQYDIGLAPQVYNPGSGSDNLPFWYFGYSAIGVEEMHGKDWNAYYHTTEDKFDKFNLTYFYKCSQLIITTHMFKRLFAKPPRR